MSDFQSIHFHSNYTKIVLPDNFQLTPNRLSLLWKSLVVLAKRSGINRILIETKNLYLAVSKKHEEVKIADTEKLPLRVACYCASISDDLVNSFRVCAHDHSSLVNFFSEEKSAVEWLLA